MVLRKNIPPYKQLTCSFCGKTQYEVRKLIAGPTVYICDECVSLCTSIVKEEKAHPPPDLTPKALPKPPEIHAHLDKYIVGQHHAKKVLAVAVYNHYKRLQNLQERKKKEQIPLALPESYTTSPTQNLTSLETEIFKSNILLIGPTGTGKTLLAQTLAKFLNVPFALADATTLTEAGYVGEDVENIVANLLIAANFDVERTEQGIIYIDEIDKIARRGAAPSMMRDVSGEGVQQALLKIVEGTKASILPRGKKYTQAEPIIIDTTNILVICGGSFTGIEQIISQRLGKRSLGFGANLQSKAHKQLNTLLKAVEPEDLGKYGLIPEFIGRLPIIATLDELGEEDLRLILTEPKNSLLKQYQKLFALEHVELLFEEKTVKTIARLANESKSGARGLRAILENVMLDIMYEIPFLPDIQRCVITEEVILKQQAPLLSFTTKKSA